MSLNLLEMLLFTLAAIMLLGSPGPGIAALLAVGRDSGMRGGLRFFWGLQIGLALAAGISAAGLFSMIQALPGATMMMIVAATLYLIWLAWKIASAPVGLPAGASAFPATARGGFLLGITNPKSYVAFVSLMASYGIVRQPAWADSGLKWLICVAVMIIVDLIWLWLGVVVGRAALSPRAERIMNICMGATIFGTAVLGLI